MEETFFPGFSRVPFFPGIKLYIINTKFKKVQGGIIMAKVITYNCEVCGSEIVVTESGLTQLSPIYCCGIEVAEISSVPKKQVKKATKAPQKATKKVAKKVTKKVTKKIAAKKTAKKTPVSKKR
jgi:hypothetical protein